MFDKVSVLPVEKFSKVLKHMKIKYFPKGEYIFKQREKGETAYVILSGKVLFLTLIPHHWETNEIPEKIMSSVEESDIVTL